MKHHPCQDTKSWVAAVLQSEEPRAAYTHCYGHALSLACSDAVDPVKVTQALATGFIKTHKDIRKNCKIMKDALDTSYKLIKLVKKITSLWCNISKIEGENVKWQPGYSCALPYKVDCQSTSTTQHSCQLWSVVNPLGWILEIMKNTEMRSQINQTEGKWP